MHRIVSLGRRWGVMLSACGLMGCAAVPERPAQGASSHAPTNPVEQIVGSNEPGPDHLSRLPGWETEDSMAALSALLVTCRATRDGDLKGVCNRTTGLLGSDPHTVRQFFEANFRAEPISGSGLLTGYYSPEYPARMVPDPEFSAPLRARPEDMVILELAALNEDPVAAKQIGRVRQGRFEAYPDRAEIERTGLGKPLLWLRPEDLFFLQIQGSGSATLPDGQRFRLIYEASNGRPFVGIAKTLRDQGLLPDNGTSAEAIRQWLSANRGPKAEEVMQTNPRYVYFSLGQDDGTEPLGAAAIALIAGRAVAIDPTQHRYGDLLWLDAGAPVLTGSFPLYQRMVSALDTGGAIKGEVRADLYLGRGEAPGLEAGRIRHNLSLYRLRARNPAMQ